MCLPDQNQPHFLSLSLSLSLSPSLFSSSPFMDMPDTQQHHSHLHLQSKFQSESSSNNSKRRKHRQEQEHVLIAGLPDHIAQLCLSSVNPSLLFSISHSWRRLIYSPSFPPFFSLYAILSPSKSHSFIEFHTFDPISHTWRILPRHPHLHHLLLRHPSFLSRNLSVQSVSAAGRLILLAATTHNLSPALPRPLIFHPLSGTWSFGPMLAAPRRWCALGVLGPAVYVASGIGAHFSIHVARSLEKWDVRSPNGDVWEKKTDLKDGRFSREAIDAVGWRQKLCMVNVKGDAAKEGAVYDVAEDAWKDMPEGMLYGWRGPVAAMEEEVMYVVDEAKGVLRRYLAEEDAWEEILENKRLKGAEQLAAEKGKLCVVSTSGISVVDVAVSPPRIIPVLLPEGFEPVAVHVLPRTPVGH
ncbi:hypothetical protein VIGAN_10127800 [Vigna angularis var. angularis]|uniref:F-box domain-containing protein n=2 Tax=Phaseolus angularis TaxID=3914 RepID=A0A0S3T3H0_PHAAN|nr:F-box/kelch-repeat protein SKIP25 [Vigna angularis]BAT99766.1 hypothetical protein VIGAN_10127800 [Vigna angularis var. angularis]